MSFKQTKTEIINIAFTRCEALKFLKKTHK